MTASERRRLRESRPSEKAQRPHVIRFAHGPETAQGVDQLRSVSTPLTPETVLSLQSTIGNAAVQRMIQRGSTVQRKDGPDLSSDALKEAIKYDKARGLSVPQIKAIQRAVGVADEGDIGTNTVRAIAHWQAKNGLDPDGKLGPRTLSRLKLSTAAAPTLDPQNHTEKELQSEDKLGNFEIQDLMSNYNEP